MTRALIAVVAALAAAPAAHAQDAPYGLHDAGGFRNVLPPGQEGVGNAADLAAFLATGSQPEHWSDQQDMYNAQIGAVTRDAFGMAQVHALFKDATFGVPEGAETSVIHPTPGATIIRDEIWGVPHIYGTTRRATMFALGYANADDRLFLMDVLRHTGRAELSSFVGGSDSNRAMDAAQWLAAPYTDEELEAQAAKATEVYGREGARVLADLDAYIAGVNAYVSEALADPTMLPGEYAAVGKLPRLWTRGDVVATASLIGGEFGRGGGLELKSALTMQAFVERFGRREGRAAWKDFRQKEDPEAPTTVRARFPHGLGDPFAPRGLALPDPGSVSEAGGGPNVPHRAPPPGSSPLANIGAALYQALSNPNGASHWELISAAESETGHPIAVMGPQVGYYVPQILMEIDVHGPGIDARGAVFPGVGLYVLLGHGRDYAFSATTAYADNVDTFAEVLCRDEFHYRYKGRCLPMEKLVRENSWTPNAGDMTPPGSETLISYRTVHGIVIGRGTVDGKKVAFVRARTTYGREADSALFFSRINNPHFMRDGAASFLKAARRMNLLFNWAYIDSESIAMITTGWLPQRARGTSTDFPVLGTGRYDWKGFDPAPSEADAWLDPDAHQADWLPWRRHPQAVDQRMLVSWNNKQAPGFAAADDRYAFGSIYRVELITDKLRRLIAGDRRASLPELVKAQGLTATQDVRAIELMPVLLEAIGRPQQPKLAKAVDRLRRWMRSGGHRRDLDGDGTYEHDAAVTTMDAWWPKLLKAQFEPALGRQAFEALHGMLEFGGAGHAPPVLSEYPGFSDGWWSYVDKDLRTLFGAREPKGAYSRVYCGNGSKQRCRAALRRSLLASLEVPREEVYGYAPCEEDAQASCWDALHSQEVSAIAIGPQPFQNRPTFQQTIAVERDVPPKR